jgi:predicted nuclease of predicted toxin-antitoxin system
MKFLVDENLPWRLCKWLELKGHAASHAARLGLLGLPDRAVIARAIADQAVIITRDTDFTDGSLTGRSPTPCIVRLAIGNCSTPELFAMLEAAWPEIETRLSNGEQIVEIR